MADTDTGFLTLAQIADEVTKQTGNVIRKQSVLNRIKKLGLLDECPMPDGVRLIPPAVASAVTDNLIAHPVKSRGQKSKRRERELVPVIEPADLIEQLREQNARLANSLDAAAANADALQRMNMELHASNEQLHERIERLNAELQEAKAAAAQYYAYAQTMATAGLGPRLRGFSNIRRLLAKNPIDGA